MELFELTRELIGIESITGNEKAVALWLRDYLAGLGYEVTLQPVAPDRFNIVATAGCPEFVFSTHIDTVPPFIPFREDEEFLYGRGACDAKGIVAAQIEAAERLRRSGESRIGLLFVVGEERSSPGALCANRSPAGSRFLINGEPTDNRLAVGSKGSLRAELEAHGRAAHSGYPEAGESAILKLLDVLQDLRAAALPSDPVLGGSTCNIGLLSGGTRANVVADRATAEVMFRCAVPVEEFKGVLERAAAGRVDVRYLFEVPIVRMNVIDGFATTVVSFTSDVPFLTAWGRPFLIGPGSILDAHTDDEKISRRQLSEGVETYVRLARALLSGG
jgi:acetylornithine deacetylase